MVENINKIRKLSIWIFIIPFVAVNTCLVLITNFHQFFDPHHIVLPSIPYIDGSISISRTARVFPTYLIFKPAMFLTAVLLIQYWRCNFHLMEKINPDLNYKKFFLFLGIISAILLILHAIFLGIKFDNTLYKIFRRLIIMFFILFGVSGQTLLVINLYKIKPKLKELINDKILNLITYLISILIIVAIVSIPFITASGYDFLKNALEWNYFFGVISFYALTFFLWRKR